MGHRKAEIYDRHYTSQIISCDTESAFLGTASKDWVIRFASHMSMTRDPHALALVPYPAAEQVAADPDIRGLADNVQKLNWDLAAKYGSVRKSKDKEGHTDYLEAQRGLRLAKGAKLRELHKQSWQAYFRDVGHREIQRQRKGLPFEIPSSKSSQMPEARAQLAQLMFRNDDVASLPSKEVFMRRNETLRTLTSLCCQCSTPPHLSRSDSVGMQPDIDTPCKDPGPEEEERIDLFGRHVCPWCYYNTTLREQQRRYSFATPKDVRRHIENCHLKYVRTDTVNPNDVLHELLLPFHCPYYLCGESFGTEEWLKNHMAESHQYFCAPGIANEFDLLQSAETTC